MPDTDLTTRRCRPCDSGTPTLPPEEVESLLSRIEGWSLADGHLEEQPESQCDHHCARNSPSRLYPFCRRVGVDHCSGCLFMSL